MRVKRWRQRGGQAFSESMGDITNREGSAEQFWAHIQEHWGIENRLHWVRDVDFAEDTARAGGKAPISWAILNCFVITIVRQLALRTIPPGVRALSNQLQPVSTILTPGFCPPKCNHPVSQSGRGVGGEGAVSA